MNIFVKEAVDKRREVFLTKVMVLWIFGTKVYTKVILGGD